LAKNRYDPFDAYLAGIAVNIGMIVTIRIMDQLRKSREIPESTAFYKLISVKAKQLSVFVAEHWRFPATVVDALQEQVDVDHQPNPSSLGFILYAANCLSQLHILVKEGQVEEDIDSLNDLLGGQLTDRYFRCYAELQRISKETTKHV
jgi:HD-like signal output (HDOD) protein